MEIEDNAGEGSILHSNLIKIVLAEIEFTKTFIYMSTLTKKVREILDFARGWLSTLKELSFRRRFAC